MPARESYPDAEEQYQWLGLLLDTYHLSDQLVADNLGLLGKNGVHIACGEGCSNCCRKPTVPVTELEIRGLSWFASEMLGGEIRQTVKQRLQSHRETAECPFLVNDVCSVYPVRPVICRQFYVKNTVCGEEEDILLSRPEDIVLPNPSMARATSMKLLEFFGIHSRLKKERAFKSGFVPQNTRPMHEHELSAIAETMEMFDAQ